MTSPTIIEEQHKEIYTHFGVVAAQISSFEMVLTNLLLVSAKRNGKVITDSDFEKMEAFLQNSKTLGELIKAVNAEITIVEPIKKLMSDALRRRNYLMHHFFRDNAFEFETEMGRRRVVEELLEARAYLVSATKLTNDLSVEMVKDFGITIDEIKTEAQELRQKAKKAESQ